MPFALSLGLPLLRTSLGELGVPVPPETAPLPPEFDDPDYAAVIDVDTGGAGDYLSLGVAEAAERRLNNALPVAFICRASTGLEDLVAVSFLAVNWGTTKVEVWQATLDYHYGIWLTNKYRRKNTITFSSIVNLLIDGIQLERVSGSDTILSINGALTTNIVRNCLGKASNTGTIFGFITTSGVIEVYNNITIGNGSANQIGYTGNQSSSGLINIDNNISVRCSTGFNSQSTINRCSNCISALSTSIDFNGAFTTKKYNLSGDTSANSGGGVNSLINESVNLKDFANNDLRLVFDSPGYKDGVASGASFNYGYDISRTAWPSVPSMGPHQGVSVDRARLFTFANAEYLSIDDNAALSGANDQSFTFAAMVNLASLSANRGISWKGTAAGTAADYEWLLFYLNGTNRFRCLISNGTTVKSLNANNLGLPVINTWYFLVCAYNVGTDLLTIQVNNGLVDSVVSGITPKPTWNSVKPFEIGRSVSSTTYMDGKICRTGFWKRALTAVELTWLFNSNIGRIRNELGVAGNDGADLLTNLQGYWNLDEFDGPANDSFGTNKLVDNNTVTSGDGPA